MNVDLGDFKDKAQISIGTFAVIFLGWLSSGINGLHTELKMLNKQMVEVIVVTRQHDKDLVQLKEFARQLNRDFVSHEEFEKEKKNDQELRLRMWDTVNKMREDSLKK